MGKKDRMKAVVLSCLLLMLPVCCMQSAAQQSFGKDDFFVMALPTQAQLPVANIHTVFQSRDGFFWYGTTGGGLCRDNGYQISVFRPADLVGIPEANSILCINEDEEGNIWVGTYAGLFRLDMETMRLSRPHADLHGMVYAIHRDCKGRLWVGMDSLIYRFAPDGSQLQETYGNLPSWRGNAFFEDRHRNFYALLSGKLMKKDAEDKFHAVELAQPIDPIDMVEDANGGLWIATWDKGVVHYDAATGTVTEQPVTQTTRDKARCLSLLIDRNDGLLWVTTYDNLYVYRIAGCRLVPFDPIPFQVVGNQILDVLYQDRDGNIWVPGFMPNTFIISRDRGSIKRLAINEMRDKTGYPLIPNRIVRKDSDFWIYQGRIGLMHYCGKTGKLGLAGGERFGMCIEPNCHGEGLWAAQGKQLMLLRHDNELQESVMAELPEDITHILDDGTNCIYIGTRQGVYELSRTSGATRKLCSSPASVMDIESCDGQLFFLAQHKGLYCWKKGLSAVHCLSASPFFSAIAANTDGTLWAVGEDGKVFHVLRDTMVLDRLMTRAGSEAFIDVACDIRGHVWTLSNQRVSEYNPQTHAFRTIRNTDAQVDAPYFFRLERMAGDSIGIGAAGALCIVPSSPELDKRSPSGRKPRVTGIVFGDSTMVLDGNATHIDLPAQQSTIALQLSTLDLFGAREISFAYRIDGANPDWIYMPQGMNTLYISNLSQGDHRLHLRATDGSGCWQEGETIILLHRQPLWWQTWWAVLLFVLLATVPLYCLWLVTLRVRKLLQIQRQRRQMALREIAAPSGQELLAQKDQEFLSAAKNFVEQHIADPQYNVERLASDLCMSRSNLHRRLQPLTGLSPVEFIRDIRLKQAATMLSTSPDLAMNEVAKRVGFSTPSYFSKCFKDRFGVLPTQYVGEGK